MNERELILQILLEAEKNGNFTGVILNQVLDKYDYLENSTKGRIKRTVSGCTERRLELDHVIDQFSKTPVRKMKPFIRVLMRMSVYQILYMEKTEDFAVCNEAVKLAKDHHFGQLSGFVNGVLRAVVRGKDTISYPSEAEDLLKSISIRCSMPEEILKIWQEAYGEEKMRQMAYAQLESRPISFRMRRDLPKEQRQALLKEMENEGLTVSQHPYAKDAYTVENLEKVTALPGFSGGLVTVQDVSSMLPASYAGIKPGDLVVDLCAAPGGKTLMAAERVGDTGQVIARDLTEEKLERIRENAARMGFNNIKTQVYDGRVTDPSLVGKADVVLADLPCSGLGVIGRKQDIKYHVTGESIRELVVLQRQILKASVPYLKKGGRLMYSTCTVTPSENEEQAAYIRDELKLTPVCFGEEAGGENAEKSLLQIFPGETGDAANMDGFFLALFEKRDE
ncbi:MAG: 16S rRNA (cytosine(967)-C(5))-methyltransferase RsmB [Lachnospiraceae bacterium]|nr:16S rRNA (cytosine(967)-C(5))-methyltransferase RsmB [Lachnospiraceae bacterium]